MNEFAVLYACNNNYAPYMGVSILSLMENNRTIKKLKIYVVLDNVSENNIIKLQQMVCSFGHDLIIIDGKNVCELMENLGVPMYRGSYATHYRKFFSLFLPSNISRVLYLDSDTIICGDIGDLVTYELNGKCLGVVWDTLGLRYKKLLGFRPEELYFNAGVTLIDVNEWKKRNYDEKLLNHIKSVRSKYCNPDQDLFNIVFKGDTCLLPVEYNFQPPHRAYSDKIYFKCIRREQYYSKSDIEKARRNPKILHTYRFLGEFPWHINNYHPDNDIFDYYLGRSPWKEYEKKRANTTVVLKAEKYIYKVMPKDLFFYFFEKILFVSFAIKNIKLKNL